jgi:hypothetical protein
MPILYPSIDGPELERYIAPLGRLMLGYGRAIYATIELVKRTKLRTEKAAADLVNNNSQNLPDDVRNLFRGRLKKDEFQALSSGLDRMKFIAKKRNQLIHGQWWFYNGQLQTRNVRRSDIKHDASYSVELLNEWASDLDKIADDFDQLEYTLGKRRRRRGGQ